MSKTNEIVFRRSCPVRFHQSASFNGAEMVDHVKSFGVMLQHKLNFELHLSCLLKQCSQRMYLLRLLCSQGLSADHLNTVTVYHALVVSRILYSLPAWGVFLNASRQSGRIDATLKRVYKCVFSNKLITVTELLTQPSTTLFRKMQNPSHCLNPLLPPNKSVNYILRNCDSSHELPHCNYTMHEKSFVNCLFNM